MEFNKGNLVINKENNRNIEFCKAQREKTLTLIEKSNTIQIKESYYSQGLKQAKIGFYFGLIGSTIESIELSKSIKRDDTRDELRSKLALFLVGMNEDKSE